MDNPATTEPVMESQAPMPTSLPDLTKTLPPPWPLDLMPEIQAKVRDAGTKLVVLDDDPTGTQTVHDVDVVTEASIATLTTALEDPQPIVYVLTNTRSMSQQRAIALNTEIACNLRAAQRKTGRRFAVVSRSDSTLRGHYPAEIQALAEALEVRVDGTLIVPFFIEGGRITAHDIHYVAEGESLTPSAETEYAHDPTFGYASSNLRDWVSEKHGAGVAPSEVDSISLEDIRVGGPEVVTHKLLAMCSAARERPSVPDAEAKAGRVCIINAVSYRDLEVAVVGILAAEARGCTFLYRTAASFVRVRGGQTPRPPLTAMDLAAPKDRGGLVVVGSHVEKTTRQMRTALTLPDTTAIELSVPDLLDGHSSALLRQVATRATAAIGEGKTALIYTSRQPVSGARAHANLEIGQTVSQAIVETVQQIRSRPAWMIAKGGITSSDIATHALGIKRARVLGQAIPGIPIWRTGAESLWPGLTYVVFPGNVGDDQALARMIEILR